ncbi:MAG: YraN family protein [Deltaproteobacteria bacterium]|nr:YraN family protein [Deltaproteobacteria bacterium]
MVNRKQAFGKVGESVAVQYLKKQGYKIIEKNYRTKVGEIDIIAKEKGSLVFVEVKTRRSRSFGSPKWAITPQKKRNLSKAALYYLKTTDQSGADARFDVVSILADEDGMEIELIRNAFDLAYP